MGILASSTVVPRSPGEMINGALALSLNIFRIPLFAKRLVAYALRQFSSPAGRNDAYANVLECMHPQTIGGERELTVLLEDYRSRWNAALKAQGVDFVLNVPCALPPMPKDGTGTATLLAANYGFLYNVVSCYLFFLSIGAVSLNAAMCSSIMRQV
jgi:hypothetical protein